MGRHFAMAALGVCGLMGVAAQACGDATYFSYVTTHDQHHGTTTATDAHHPVKRGQNAVTTPPLVAR